MKALWLTPIFGALAAGCAATPYTTAASAAVEAVEAGVPACEPGHEGALSNGVVTIRPGETICLAMREDGSTPRPTGVVATGSGSASTIVLRSWQSGEGVFLTAHNPFPEQVKYRAGVLIPGEQHFRRTSSCPVLSNHMSLEHWPHPIVALVLADVHFAAGDGVCD